MADLDDAKGSRGIVNRADDPVGCPTNSGAVVARQLPRAWRAQIVRELGDSIRDGPTIFLVGRSSISRQTERLSPRLYLSTPPQISYDALEREARPRGALQASAEVVGQAHGELS